MPEPVGPESRPQPIPTLRISWSEEMGTEIVVEGGMLETVQPILQIIWALRSQTNVSEVRTVPADVCVVPSAQPDRVNELVMAAREAVLNQNHPAGLSRLEKALTAYDEARRDA